jgi:hypothetical protein
MRPEAPDTAIFKHSPQGQAAAAPLQGPAASLRVVGAEGSFCYARPSSAWN